MHTLDIRIPRSACSPREHVRAADIWRLCQEAAVAHSIACDWPPHRYRETQTGWIVRELVGIHQQELLYPSHSHTQIQTWIAQSRRRLLFRRETRIQDTFWGSVDWVFVGGEAGAWGPKAAPDDLTAAFAVEHHGDAPHFPSLEKENWQAGPDYYLEPLWTEMDPQGHTNHPRYVEWADEAIARWIFQAGLDPLPMRAVAERVRYRAEARAADRVRVEVAWVGTLDLGTRVFDLKMTRIGAQEPVKLCDARLIRHHPDWK